MAKALLPADGRGAFGHPALALRLGEIGHLGQQGTFYADIKKRLAPLIYKN